MPYTTASANAGHRIVRSLVKKMQTAHWLFLVIALIAGVCLVTIVPPFWGNDENAHFARTYQITSGHLMAQKMADGAYGGQLPANVVALYNYISNDAVNNPNIFMASDLAHRHDVNQPENYKLYTRQHRSTQLANLDFPATASYSPVAYIGPIIGMTIARLLNVNIGHFFTLARITTLLVYCACVYTALYVLRAKKIRWLVFSIALIPNALIAAALISTDSIILGLSLLLFALFVAAFDQNLTARAAARLRPGIAIVAVLLPLTKPAYFPLIFLLLLLPSRLWASRRSSLVYKASIVGFSLILFALWTYKIRLVSATVPLMNGPALAALTNPHKQIQFVAHHLTYMVKVFIATVLSNDEFFTTGAFGSVGWNSALIPTWLAALSFSGLLIAAFYDAAEAMRNRRVRLIAAALGIVIFIVIFATFYITYTPVGQGIILGVQGRYFIPIMAYLFAALAAVLPIKLDIPQRKAPLLFATLSAVIAIATVAFYGSILY